MRRPMNSPTERSRRGTRKAACALVALAAAFPNEARSAGFAVYEQGVAATAQGGAFTARAPDASAVYFNPAALVTHEGKESHQLVDQCRTNRGLLEAFDYCSRETTFEATGETSCPVVDGSLEPNCQPIQAARGVCCGEVKTQPVASTLAR